MNTPGITLILAAFALCAVAGTATDRVRAQPDGFEVYFMRHGETPWNRAKVLQGSIGYTDITETGIGMAEDSARELKRRGIAFDAVYSSPYLRALHTAQIVADSQGLRPRVDDRIRERCCGSCEGVRYPGGFTVQYTPARREYDAFIAMMEEKKHA